MNYKWGIAPFQLKCCDIFTAYEIVHEVDIVSTSNSLKYPQISLNKPKYP